MTYILLQLKLGQFSTKGHPLTGHGRSSVKISDLAMSMRFQASASFSWSITWSLLAEGRQGENMYKYTPEH